MQQHDHTSRSVCKLQSPLDLKDVTIVTVETFNRLIPIQIVSIKHETDCRRLSRWQPALLYGLLLVYLKQSTQSHLLAYPQRQLAILALHLQNDFVIVGLWQSRLIITPRAVVRVRVCLWLWLCCGAPGDDGRGAFCNTTYQ